MPCVMPSLLRNILLRNTVQYNCYNYCMSLIIEQSNYVNNPDPGNINQDYVAACVCLVENHSSVQHEGAE